METMGYRRTSVVALQELIDSLPGRYAVFAKNLVNNKTFDYHANETFPSASVIKIPILMELYRRVEESHLSLDHLLLMGKEDQVGGSGVLKDLTPATEYSLRDLATLMITVSDNTATNLLIDYLGVDNINATIRHLGAQNTELIRKLQRVPAEQHSRVNHTCAYDMALLMEKLATGTATSLAVSEEMVSLLSRCQGPVSIAKAPADPPFVGKNDVLIAHKTGSLSEACHDVGIVYSPQINYIAAILSEGAPYPTLLTNTRRIGSHLTRVLR
jgi:beta-lactamase class A